MKKLLLLNFLIISLLSYSKNETGIRLKEKVITTTGFDETVKNEIKNIIVVSKEDIEKKHYNQVTDILKNYAMINVIGTGQGTVVNMRGQNQSAIDMKVKVMVDGVSLNTMMSPQGINTIPVSMIEKIEILPGSGAVLYGDRASGGYINIITKKSQNKSFVSLDSGIGSYNKKYTSIITGVKLSNNLSTMVGYNGVSKDGYRDEDREIENSYLTSLNYKITENQNITLKGERYKADTIFSSSIKKDELEKDRKKAGDLSKWNSKRESYQANYLGKFDNLTLGVDLFKSKIDNDTLSNRYTTCTMNVEGVGLKTKYNHLNGIFLAGYDYNKNTGIMKSSSTEMEVDKITNAFYILEKYNLTDKLVLNLGGRKEWNEYEGYRKTKKESLEIDNEITNESFDIGINYLYNETGNLYLKFEKGFVAPTPRQLANRIKGEYVGNNLKAENSYTYELGIKDIIYNSYLSMTAFLTTIEDEISYQSLGNRNFRYENLDETERKGIEINAEQYFDKLTLNESVSWIDAKIKKGIKKGEKIPNVPKTKFVLSATYEINEKVDLNTSVNYVGNMNTGNYNKSSNIVTDLALKYKLSKGLDIYAGINNIFNEKYYLEEDELTGIPAEERNYYVGFKYEI